LDLEEAMPTEANFYYIHVPSRTRPVVHEVRFLPIHEFLADEEACRTLWDMVTGQFHTRGKFLAIWQCVRFVAVHRDAAGVAGLLLVSAPANWQIDYVVVREDRRGQGIATSLVNETTNRALALGVPYVMLTSRANLRTLYESQCGFTPVAGPGGPLTSPKCHVSQPAPNGR
jgi:GNAT superfamily N-acetyltransferase